MTFEQEQKRIWELRQEIRDLDEQREELENELRSYDGYHGVEPSRIYDQMSDATDRLDRARRLIRFYEGNGFLVTLRIQPEEWQNENPAEWNWQEMLDMEAVRLVSCCPVAGTPMAQMTESIQGAK